MATTFDSIIKELQHLSFQDSQLSNIKARTYEMIKRTFPESSDLIIDELKKIKFRPTRGDEYDVEVWNIGLAEFLGIMEAKQETYEIQKTTPKNSPESISLEIENKQLTEQLQLIHSRHSDNLTLLNESLKAKNNELINERRIVIEKQKELEEKDKELLLKDNLIRDERSKRMNFDIAYWTLIVGIAAFVLFAGYYWGYNRFDSEKLTMRDTITNLTKQNKELKDSLNSRKPIKLTHKSN